MLCRNLLNTSVVFYPFKKRIEKMKVISIILVSVSLILSQQALSDVISPNTVTASSTFDSYSLPDLVNGSGITGGLDGGTHGEEYTDMWLSDGGDLTP